MTQHSWLIPLIPALAFAVILFAGTRLPKRGAEVGIAAISISLVLTLWHTVQWIRGDGVQHVSQHSWFTWAQTEVKIGTIDDGLTSMMLFVVAFISLLVQIFSTSYMKNDARYTHYFAIVSLFTAAMQWFAISGNLLQAIIGWEVMGLCSFLLIGHWWEQKRNVHAAMKAFMTTRVSDAGFIVGIILLFFATGSFQVTEINAAILNGSASGSLITLAAISFFIAVIGKSAQFPLHTWLPDAMAGPTPISALIHAATMVVAGVYLMARMFPVFAEGMSIGVLGGADGGINPVAFIGGVTIVIAALLAFVQTDIKKVLSYSTVSQLGYMVMAIGVGAWTAAVFHLFCHAFFKALLFLTSGSISHAVHGFDIEQDMGGLRKHMPITHATFAIGGAALIGVIPLAGFWSKEEIIAQAGHNGYTAFAVVGLIGTFLTAAYMMRLYYFVFMGDHRGRSVPHEAPPALTVPCIILAIASIGAGFLQAPALGSHLFEHWVTPDYINRSSDEASILVPFLVELGLTAAGVSLALAAFAFNFGPRSLAKRFTGVKAVYSVLLNRYYLDWLYERVIVRFVRRGLASLVRLIDTNVVDGAVKGIAGGASSAGGVLSAVQNGRVQRYIGVMFLGITVVVFILAAGY